MTHQEVFDTLGLWDLDKAAVSGMAGGSFSHSWIVWVIDQKGHELSIGEEFLGPGQRRLRSVSLDGVTWNRDENPSN